MKLRQLLVVALAAAASVIAPGVARAAAWQPATPISDPGANASESPRIALGAAGDAAAIWWDDGLGGRVMLARRLAGGAWSAPAPLASTGTLTVGQVGVDGAGTVTAAFTAGGATQIATWAAAAQGPTVVSLPVDAEPNLEEVMSVQALAVDAAGDAILAGLGTTNPGSVIVGYRHGPGGSFQFTQRFPSGDTFKDLRVAINDSGSALAAWRTVTANAAYGLVRTAADASWGPHVSTVPGVTVAGDALSAAVDASGNAYIAFTADPAPVSAARIVGVAVHAPGGAWLPATGLSPAGTVATDVSIAVAPTGSSLLVWRQEGAAPLDAKVLARSGSAATGTWGAVETLNEAASVVPTAVMGKDGRAVAAWMHLSFTGITPQARVRAADGTWGAVTPLAAEVPGNTATLPLATDGAGDFATVATPAGAPRRVVVSVYDGAPPAVSEVALAGSPLAGEALTLGVTATDAWSTVPAAPWAFGDGSTGSGLSVAHSFANAGTYTATVTVADAAGNAVVRQVAVTIAAEQSALTGAKFSAKWSQSRVKGTLALTGAVPRAGKYVVTLALGKAVKLRATLALPAGAFKKSLKLPAKLVPGTYRVTLAPPFLVTQVTPAARNLKLAAPVSGVVDSTTLSGARNGPSATTLRNVDTVWATFHFAAVPKGTLTITWFITPKGGKRQALGSAIKPHAVKVASFIRLNGLRGKLTALISRKGVIIAQRSVTAK